MEFRGIRDLTLDLHGKNFAICGPNGTGKSGVVDAIEFGLTGRISRLEGEGRGDVSATAHGPHVDKKDSPEHAIVSLRISSSHLSKPFTVERNVKNPTMRKVSSDDPLAEVLIMFLEHHPEFVLSRRELIRYVLATPGKRSEEVQAVLRLDRINQVRTHLVKIANTFEKQLSPLRTAQIGARDNLLKALGTSSVKQEHILEAANAQRQILSLPPLTALTATSSLKEGLASVSSPQLAQVSKIQALKDISALQEAIASVRNEKGGRVLAEAKDELLRLSADTKFENSAGLQSFYISAQQLIVEDECPLCDTAWDIAALKKHVTEKLARLKEVVAKRKEIEGKLKPLAAALRDIRPLADAVLKHAGLLRPPIPCESVSAFASACSHQAESLARFLPLSETILAADDFSLFTDGLSTALENLSKAANGLPEPTKQDAARDWLVLAQERLEQWRDGMRKLKAAEEGAALSKLISDAYNEASDRNLTTLYSRVEGKFGDLYRGINRGDEDKFAAQLTPSFGKLGFDVDFYGRGLFPPGAYHSEGHQDAMGLCLYLSLMHHLRGANFTLAVLDDVVMSIDAGHRREICALLKSEFPNTQFIITTHDPIWLRHMRTEGLVASSAGVLFRNWSIDSGPARWDAKDIWAEVDEYLVRNDVRGAAALLRHYLEYESAELCHRLRAPVAFRGDAQYQLGELLPSALGQLSRLFGSAKKSANSWNQRETVERLATCDATFKELVKASQADQWQVNTAVHFNSWENLSPSEFRRVVEAFQRLLGGFRCNDCSSYMRIAPERDSPEFLRCDCGRVSYNLVCK